MFKHSIASVSLSGTLKEKMFAVAKAGYDGIELFENDLTSSDISPKELNKMASDLGIEIVALQPFRDYEAMPEPFKSRSLERAKHKFELMHYLGTKKLFICSNTSPHTINNLNKAAEDLFDMAELAKIHGFEIGYEALSWGQHVKYYQQSIEIVSRANHPNLGNILDNFHISALNSKFDEIYNIPSSKITIIQVADALKFDMGAMYLGRHHRSFPGQGSFPVVEFLEAVRATGYEGYLSHEVFSDEFRSSQIDPVALDGKRSLIWLEGITNPIHKESKIDISSIEFIEFCSNASNQKGLINMLENLGFVEMYQHKTKEVSIFQLGEVNIVINRQQKSPAENRPNTVCAIGFVTDNKQKIKKWATDLQYKWHDGKQNPNELDIPSVEGIGGILYYFIDEKQLKNSFYEVEFNHTQKEKIGNGIIGIDHIGHSSFKDFYLSNTLFFRALLGFEIDESLEILDPRGIVYSRVAKNKKGNIRIPLSSSKSQATSIDQFISQSGGSGIQQIALETVDIFQTAVYIKNTDLILQIPANYYDDLRAKTTLSEEIIAKMQNFNILYDKQDEGEFFHFYCKELNGLFMEVIQRKGNYNRFGEVNAQVRLAAQERNRNQ